MLKKVTASQVYEVSNVIKRLANSPLPIKIAYAFSKNIKSITRELEELSAKLPKKNHRQDNHYYKA